MKFKLTVTPLGESSPLIIIKEYGHIADLWSLAIDAQRRGFFEQKKDDGSIYCVPWATTASFKIESYA